ncbi:hypothetical protein GCM10020367_43460 [Streptomyces sannanensis]|uniref:Uncharacterized protein n=1 Tax=Streptomyces sannanensis TaxID=285536 RepID=A0ABP6SFQ9_9ACTN
MRGADLRSTPPRRGRRLADLVRDGGPVRTRAAVTANGKMGFRIEFDDRSGAHINVWAGKEKGPHFQFNATETTVTKLQGLHGCG